MVTDTKRDNPAYGNANKISQAPFGGTNRIKFVGYNLSPSKRTPLLCCCKINIIFASAKHKLQIKL